MTNKFDCLPYLGDGAVTHFGKSIEEALDKNLLKDKEEVIFYPTGLMEKHVSPYLFELLNYFFSP